MPYTQQQNKCITLKGSASMVRQYLHHGINNVLYQRGACPSREFEQTRYYGLDLFTLKNPRHTEYITRMLGEIENFIIAKEVASVKLVLKNSRTQEVLEKWEFKVDYSDEKSNAKSTQTDPQTIRNEICAVMRQIIGAATILPLLDKHQLTHEIRAQPRSGVPEWPGWNNIIDSHDIANKQDMEFRSFSTSIHSVSTSVSYKGV